MDDSSLLWLELAYYSKPNNRSWGKNHLNFTYNIQDLD